MNKLNRVEPVHRKLRRKINRGGLHSEPGVASTAKYLIKSTVTIENRKIKRVDATLATANIKGSDSKLDIIKSTRIR